MIYAFADCELDEQLCELRCGGEPRHVEPQVFDVLLHLVRNPNRLVTRDELLDEIWGHRFVTPATVSARIKSARRAVGDDGKAQKVIRTVRGRGFRMAIPVELRGHGGQSPTAAAPVDVTVDASLVARGRETEKLREALTSAAAGSRRVVLVSGESGIGKTTLVSAFVDGAEAEGVLVGRGQSIEQGGVGEPYLPVLDALGRLSRGPRRTDVLEVLQGYAPTWLAQMPSLLGGGAPGPAAEAASATRERMLREVVEALEALAQRVPVILVLEDLHWADRSTLDLLYWLALRPEPARLLVLGTIRTGSEGPELRAMVTKLRRHEGSSEIAVHPWTTEDIGAYLDARLGGSDLPPDLPRLTLDRSAGNPLFVKSLCDEWVDRGDLAKRDGLWQLTTELETLGSDLPTSLHDSIELQVDRLDDLDQEILEAASVLGGEFLSTVVAGAIDRPDEEVERVCTRLARTGSLVADAGSNELPDGTVSARFELAHDLYREALYGRIPPQRRVRMHARAAARLECAFGADAEEHAGELALHYTRGKKPERAVEWLTVAARRAMRQSAHHEAVTHLEAALELLERDSSQPDALARELELQQMLGPARLEIGGWDDPGAERAYSRARQIAAELQDLEGEGKALYGLAYLHEVRGEYPIAQSILQERLALSESRPDPWGSLEAYDLLGCSLFHEGHFADAMTNAARAVESAGASMAGGDADVSPHHPAVSSRYWAATLHWFLGEPDEALRMASEALHVAGKVGHLPTLVFAEVRKARIHQFLQEPEECAACAERALALSDEHGFPYQRSVALTLAGWAEAMLGDAERGVERIEEGLSFQEETGTVMDYPYGVGLLAEALLVGGDATRALTAAERAASEIESLGGDFFWSAEVQRLRGEALAALSRTSEAEQALARAAEIARRQGAPALELRALLSRSELEGSSAHEEVLARIEDVLRALPESCETVDTRRAHGLLE